MKKVLKFLKPYTWMVVVCLVLMLGQCWSDLELPDIMSNIVNIGILQGGINEAVPKQLSSDGMELVTSFMKEEDKMAFRSLYEEGGDYWILKESADASDVIGPFAKACAGAVTCISETATQKDISVYNKSSAISVLDMNAVHDMSGEFLTREDLFEAYTDEAKASVTVTASFIKALYQEQGVDTTAIQRGYFVREGGYMLLIALFAVGCALGTGYLAAWVGSAYSRDLRRNVFQKIESFGNAEFDKFSTASLITRTTNDVTGITMVVTMGMRMMARAPIMGIGGIIKALQKSISMSWIIALALAILVAVIFMIFKIIRPRFEVRQKLTDMVNLVAREQLSGMMVIRAFGNEEREERRFDDNNDKLLRNNRFVQRVSGVQMCVIMFLMNIVNILIVWFGAKQIAASQLALGDMMAYTQYAMHVIMSFEMISMIFLIVPRAAVSGRRIAEVLDTEISIFNPEKPVDLPEGSNGRTVKFDHVGFRYGQAENEVLHDVSFTAEPGKTTAIIGLTGSGKSTLVNLIPRFYDVTSGKISIDGVDLRDADLKQIRDAVGYVPQKGTLFFGTIDENIHYGKAGTTEEEIEDALRVAQATDFVNELEGGREYMVSQGGTNVSGGQRQRLAIARALVKKPPIYIFDDSFSALDFKTDSELRKALASYTDNTTVIIVAQRVSTIMHADQIMVLDVGKVVGMGTHAELLQTCEEYREIAESQLSKGEIEAAIAESKNKEVTE